MEFNYAIDILGLTIVCVLLFSDRKNDKSGRPDRQMFTALLFSIALVFIFDIPAWLIIGKEFAGARIVGYILDTAYYLAQIVYCLLWLIFADCWNYSGSEKLKKRSVIYAIPAVAEIAVILINPFTGWIFTLDEHNVYSRGDYYIYNLIPYVLYILGAILITCFACFKNKSEIQKKQSVSFLVYMILPIIGTLLQMFNYGVSLLWPFTVMSLMMIYLNVQQQNEMMNQLEKAHAEQNLAQANISIMLSQIQPHFLYNSLTVIKNLCRRDPALAEKVTVSFSNYLRANLDSISAKKPVCFSQELEHTKNFLSLETLQYGDSLDIEFDIASEDFLIPTLTLQPLAENAVKYGMKYREHVTVKIASYEDALGYHVTVEDDGNGFDPEAPFDKAKSHIGLGNVKNRLAAQTGGSLEIQSIIGSGTKIIITIPKERNTV